jgi:cell division transport system permease protein
MSLASISIVSATLIIFGIFLLITINLNQNTKVLNEQPEMIVYCDPQLDDTQIIQVEDTLKQNDKIAGFTQVSKQQALENYKKLLGNNQNILEGLDESFLPVSYVIKLKDSKDSEAVIEQVKKISGVENVKYSQGTIAFIAKISYWIKLISILLIAILLVVSMFIISNTIKLTVFARRKEISIMKYIGATDWFIRWPFIIEGVIIGFIGAFMAFILIYYSYSAIEGNVNGDLSRISISFIQFVKVGDVGLQIIAVYLLIGIVVGGLGSLISIRKYLKV